MPEVRVVRPARRHHRDQATQQVTHGLTVVPGRPRAPLTDRLVRALPGVDVRIVADRSKRER
jgi:hypothetical protein